MTPHVVSLQKLKDVGGDNGRGHVNIVNGGCMNLTVIRGALER
jgi:hypothetical protein